METKQDIFSNITIEETDLWEMSRHLQRVDWICLGHDLGLKNSDIDMIRATHKFDGTLEIIINRMLTTWHEQFPSDCNLATLLRALVKRNHLNTAKSIGERLLKKRSGHSTKESSQVLEEYIEELKEVEILISFDDDDDEEDNEKNAGRPNMSASREKRKAGTSVIAHKANETLENMKNLFDDDCGIAYKMCAYAYLTRSRAMHAIQKSIGTFEYGLKSGKNKNIHRKLDQLKAYKCTTASFVFIKIFFYNVLDLNRAIDEKDQTILVKPKGKSLDYIQEKLDNNRIEIMELGKLLMDNIKSDYDAHSRISKEIAHTYEFVVNDLNLCTEYLIQAKKDLKSFDSIESEQDLRKRADEKEHNARLKPIQTVLNHVRETLHADPIEVLKLGELLMEIMTCSHDEHQGMHIQFNYSYDLIVCDINVCTEQLMKAKKELDEEFDSQKSELVFMQYCETCPKGTDDLVKLSIGSTVHLV